jgi:hypothetical protein
MVQLAEQPNDWIIKKLIEENCVSFRNVWDMYLKFYTVFLTFNLTSLGLTIQYVARENRWPIIVALILQNAASAGTAIGVGEYSTKCAKRFQTLCGVYQAHTGAPVSAELEALFGSTLPGRLGRYGGWANFAGHLTLIMCWTFAFFIPTAAK